MSIAEKLTTVAENVPKVYEAGKQAEYDFFWDNFQSNGERTNYHTAFARSSWKNDTTYRPKYPIVCRGSNTATSMFSYTGVKDTLVPITISGSNNSVFYSAGLVTIHSLDISGVTTVISDWFTSCTRLANIIVEGEIPVSLTFKDCTALTADSITSIMTALSDTATGKTITLSDTALHAAFDTEFYEYGGNPEWIDLITAKSNWTISIV